MFQELCIRHKGESSGNNFIVKIPLSLSYFLNTPQFKTYLPTFKNPDPFRLILNNDLVLNYMEKHIKGKLF